MLPVAVARFLFFFASSRSRRRRIIYFLNSEKRRNVSPLYIDMMRPFLSFLFLFKSINAADPALISYSSSSSSVVDDDSFQSSIRQHQRHLQAIGGCSFDDLVSGSDTCSLSAYCKTSSPSTFIECGGDLSNRWVIRLEETKPRCYNDPDDRTNFYFPDSSTVLQNRAYCSSTTLTFSFAGGLLTSVESSEQFTAPEKYNAKTLLSVQSVQPCSTNPDWATFGDASYCYVQCPQELSVDGEACQVACLECSDGGRQSFSCPNFYPFFGYNCFDANPPSNFHSEVFALFDQGDATIVPTAAPVPVIVPTQEPTPPPTAAPVRAPTFSPSRTPTMAPQTPPPTTPEETPPPTGTPSLAQTVATENPSLDSSTFAPTPLKEPPTKPIAPPVNPPVNPPVTPPVKRTEAPVVVVSQAPTSENSFFVDGPIDLSPVFLAASSSARIWSTGFRCTLVTCVLVVLAY